MLEKAQVFRSLGSLLVLIFVLAIVPAGAQKPADPAADRQPRKPAAQEDMRYYQRWLDEDVRYLITAEEKSVFKSLTTNEEREKFIDDFWRRRDPSPETLQNEFKEEHYRRIAYSNDMFAAGKPGWMTDRGRIYITFGPPDRKETNPTGTQLQRSEMEGGNMTTYPFEVWEYRYIEGIGSDITIEFVDRTGTNDYQIALNDNEKDALFSITGSQVATGNDSQRMVRAKDMPFERLNTYMKLQQPPQIKFKKLEEAVSARVSYNQLPMEVQDNYLRITDESVLTAVALEFDNSNLSFEGAGDDYLAYINLYGRVTDISKRTVEVFEDSINAHLTSEQVKQGSKGKSLYQKKMMLRPGRYVIDAVAEDKTSGRMGSVQKLLVVPRLGGENGALTTSSMILAATIMPATTAADLQSQFVIGDLKVIPSVRRLFRSGDKIGIYLQVYNLALDQTRLKPTVSVSAVIKKGDQTLSKLKSSDLAAHVSGQQMTLKGVVDTAGLAPGGYKLELTVSDGIAGKSITRAESFTIQ